MIDLRKAKADEAGKILKFYHDVIHSIKNSEFKPKWNESYPNLEYIETCIEKQELYTYTTEHDIIVCIVLNNLFGPESEHINWKSDATPDETTIIHTFAVDSRFAGKGIGKEIFNQIKRNTLKNCQKSIRLDVIDGNVGAEKFFKKLGFEYVDTVEIFHDAVGLEKFHFYELVLKN